MEKYYKISESSLRELIEQAMRYIALENGGVDNWEWHDLSIRNYFGFMYELHRPALGDKSEDEMSVDEWVDFLIKDYEVCED